MIVPVRISKLKFYKILKFMVIVTATNERLGNNDDLDLDVYNSPSLLSEKLLKNSSDRCNKLVRYFL